MSDNAPDSKQEETSNLPELHRHTSEEQDLEDNKNIESNLSSILDACIKNGEFPLNLGPSYDYIINKAEDVTEEDRQFIKDNQNVGESWFYHAVEYIVKNRNYSEKTKRALVRIIIMERYIAAVRCGGFNGGHLFAICYEFNSLLFFNKLEESKQQRQFFKENFDTLLDEAYALVRRRRREEEEEEEERRRRRRRREEEEEEEERRRWFEGEDRRRWFEGEDRRRWFEGEDRRRWLEAEDRRRWLEAEDRRRWFEGEDRRRWRERRRER